jgi:outer membrane lipoprotein-sorting protein
LIDAPKPAVAFFICARRLKTLRVRGAFWMVAWCAASLWISGCSGHTVPVAKVPAKMPLRTAGKADLVAAYNQLAQGVTSINAGVTMQLTATSSYTGVITQYHQVEGFLLAQSPSKIRVIGQAPVIGTNIFDMVSDGKTFQIFVPSRNQFLTGPARLEKPSDKPVENLRPQHLLEAVFWEPTAPSAPVLVEQVTDSGKSYYVLTIVENNASVGAQNPDWRIARKIWFERVSLTMARMQDYRDDGQMDADVNYAQWDAFSGVRYPKLITLARPEDGYTLQIAILKLAPNEEISSDRFVLAQPAGAQLVEVGAQEEGETK